ncbi:MAG: hypothetical protein IPI69_00365 [Bacteroidales bacterium]|nr:hypothetical protein [Bacteroidales bacterium]MBP7039000.1 hypothetical protein [Bacteroidales bacterium]
MYQILQQKFQGFQTIKKKEESKMARLLSIKEPVLPYHSCIVMMMILFPEMKTSLNQQLLQEARITMRETLYLSDFGVGELKEAFLIFAFILIIVPVH